MPPHETTRYIQEAVRTVEAESKRLALVEFGDAQSPLCDAPRRTQSPQTKEDGRFRSLYERAKVVGAERAIQEGLMVRSMQ